MLIVDDGGRRGRESGGIGCAEGVRRNARERAGKGVGAGAPENPERRHQWRGTPYFHVLINNNPN